MTIRKAVDSDAAVLAAIHRESREDTMPWLPKLHTAAEDLFFFESSVMKNCEVLVAQDGERVVGFAAIRAEWLDHLYVRPGAYGQGWGTKLLDHAKMGRRELQLWAFQRNANARDFYEKRGFVEVELTDGHLNEEREPDVRYVWRA